MQMSAQNKLIKKYKDKHNELFDFSLKAFATGTSGGLTQLSTLRELNKTTKELDCATMQYAEDIITQAYKCDVINRPAVQLMIDNFTNELITANHFVGRHAQDIIREIGLDAMIDKASYGQALKDSSENLVSKLIDKGFDSIEYSNGAKVGLEKYAEMLIRTLGTETANVAAIDNATSQGNDLVIMSVHYPTCSVCAPLQGRVYSISGEDDRFPWLFELPGFDEGFYTLHPHCKHVLSALKAEKYWTDEERKKYLADGKKSLYKDERTKEEVDKYNAIRREKSERWQDRKQYDRYRAILGKEAPKTFSGFRATKRADGDNWNFMQLDYKRRLRLINNPDLALPNADVATAADNKFIKYLYNPKNADGWSKGVALNSRLGYNESNWEELKKLLLNNAIKYPVIYKGADRHGNSFEQLQIIYGLKGNPANVLVAWKSSDDKTWMSSAYIKGVK